MVDIVASVDTEEEAMKATKEIDVVINASGYKIKEWFISRSEQASTNVNIPLNKVSRLEETEGVLGLEWFPGIDFLRIKVGSTGVISDNVTKRSVLSAVSQIYDPLDLLPLSQ